MKIVEFLKLLRGKCFVEITDGKEIHFQSAAIDYLKRKCERQIQNHIITDLEIEDDVIIVWVKESEAKK